MSSLNYSPDILERMNYLTQKSNEKKLYLQEFQYILSDCVSLQEYYSRNLQQLGSRLIALITGKDLMKDIMCNLKNFFTIHAEQSRSFSKSIQSDIIEPLKEFIYKQDHQKNSITALCKRHEQQMKEYMDRLEALRSQYISIGNQIEQEPKNSSRLGNMEKEQVALESKFKHFIENQYNNHKPDFPFRRYIEDYFNDYSKMTEKFENLEIGKRNELKDSIMKFLVFQISLIRNIQYDVESISQQIEEIDSKSELAELKKQQPSNQPLLCKLRYENYQTFMDTAIVKTHPQNTSHQTTNVNVSQKVQTHIKQPITKQESHKIINPNHEHDQIASQKNQSPVTDQEQQGEQEEKQKYPSSDQPQTQQSHQQPVNHLVYNMNSSQSHQNAPPSHDSQANTLQKDGSTKPAIVIQTQHSHIDHMHEMNKFGTINPNQKTAPTQKKAGANSNNPHPPPQSQQQSGGGLWSKFIDKLVGSDEPPTVQEKAKFGSGGSGTANEQPKKKPEFPELYFYLFANGIQGKQFTNNELDRFAHYVSGIQGRKVFEQAFMKYFVLPEGFSEIEISSDAYTLMMQLVFVWLDYTTKFEDVEMVTHILNASQILFKAIAAPDDENRICQKIYLNHGIINHPFFGNTNFWENYMRFEIKKALKNFSSLNTQSVVVSHTVLPSEQDFINDTINIVIKVLQNFEFDDHKIFQLLSSLESFVEFDGQRRKSIIEYIAQLSEIKNQPQLQVLQPIINTAPVAEIEEQQETVGEREKEMKPKRKIFDPIIREETNIDKMTGFINPNQQSSENIENKINLEENQQKGIEENQENPIELRDEAQNEKDLTPDQQQTNGRDDLELSQNTNQFIVNDQKMIDEADLAVFS